MSLGGLGAYGGLGAMSSFGGVAQVGTAAANKAKQPPLQREPARDEPTTIEDETKTS